MRRFDLRAALPRHAIQLFPALGAELSVGVYRIIADGAAAGQIGFYDRDGTRIVEMLHVAPKFRRQRIGSYVLRWMARDAVARGARRIEATVPCSNAAAIKVLRAAGFTSVNVVGQSVRMSRRISPLTSVQTSAEAFAALRGTKIVTQHIALGELAATALCAVPGVQLVLGLGSIGRGFGDGSSDIDLFIIGRGTDVQRIPSGERWIAGFDFDLFVFDLDEAPYSGWDDDRRQAIGEGAVLWAENAGAISELRHATRMRRSEQRTRIAETLLSLSWLGFHPPSLDGRTEFGYFWTLPHDLWIQRGHLASAHASIDEAVGYLLALLFFANQQFLAPRKWRRYLVEWLPWTPERFSARLSAIEGGARDEPGFTSRARSVLSLIEETFGYIRDCDLVPPDVYRAYQRASPDYSSHNALRLRKGHADR